MASYIGGVYHSDFENGRKGGALELSASGIRFTLETKSYSIPLDGLEISRGGSGNRMLFFKNSHFPETSFYTTDSSILKELQTFSEPALQEQIQKLRLKQRVGLYFILSILFLIIASVWGLTLLKDPMIKTVVNQIPYSWEQKLGETAFKQITLTTKFREDSATKAFLKELTEPLLDSTLKTKGFQFHYSESSQINAFALPGGIVVINDGLVKNAKKVEDIQGVLAHEISHVTERHGMRSLIASTGLYVLLQAFVGDISGLLAILLANGDFLLTQQFSRDHEREADKVGFALLVQQRVNPQGMVDFFKILKSKESDVTETLSETLSFLSTHPATQERIDYLQDKVDKLDSQPWLKQKNLLNSYLQQNKQDSETLSESAMEDAL